MLLTGAQDGRLWQNVAEYLPTASGGRISLLLGNCFEKYICMDPFPAYTPPPRKGGQWKTVFKTPPTGSIWFDLFAMVDEINYWSSNECGGMFSLYFNIFNKIIGQTFALLNQISAGSD